MLSTSDRLWVSFVAKVNQDTRRGDIQWNIEEQPTLHSSDVQQYGPVYVTNIGSGNEIRLYKENIRRIDADTEENFWQERVVLEMKPDPKGDYIRVPPKIPGVDDLYETVVYKTHRVEDFLSRFLKEN
jgi:DNA-binding beta-propeller fold protein YncE